MPPSCDTLSHAEELVRLSKRDLHRDTVPTPTVNPMQATHTHAHPHTHGARTGRLSGRRPQHNSRGGMFHFLLRIKNWTCNHDCWTYCVFSVHLVKLHSAFRNVLLPLGMCTVVSIDTGSRFGPLGRPDPSKQRSGWTCGKEKAVLVMLEEG